MDRESKSAWFDQTVTALQPRLLRYARRLLGSEAQAGDLVQEAFLRLWSAEPAPAQDRTAAWLFAVCRNLALDVLRKERRMSPLDVAQVDAPAPQPTPAETAERNESAAAALKCLSRLPANQQEVIRLKFQEGFTYRQIAEITGLSPGNVGFLLHTAIATLRAGSA